MHVPLNLLSFENPDHSNYKTFIIAASYTFHRNMSYLEVGFDQM